jgi:phage terminase large subunit GpA-like protein
LAPVLASGPGYLHLPDWVDEEYLAQLTAEKAIRKYVKGRGAVREWVKLRERNEALDLEVYALAALYIGGQSLLRSLEDRAAQFARPVSELPKPEDEQSQPVARRSGWIRPRPGWIRNY